MPSTTPNYGWTYPISSDDLNAGATSIGSFATGADASLASEAAARAAADSAEAAARVAADNQRPTSNKSAINFVYASVATDSNGIFTLSGGTTKYVVQAWEVGIGFPCYIAKTNAFNQYQLGYWWLNDFRLMTNSIIALYYIEVP